MAVFAIEPQQMWMLGELLVIALQRVEVEWWEILVEK